MGTNEAVLTNTHNLCFGAKIRKIDIPLHTPVCFIKVGFKGVYIVRTCFYDVLTFQWIFSYGIRLHPMAQEVLQEWYDILGMLQKISDTGDERLQRSYWFKATYYRFG